MIRKSYLAICIVVLIFLGACRTVTRNDMEKKIEGKWHNIGGSGMFTEINSLFDYTFTDEKVFIREINIPSDKTIVFKNWSSQKGLYQIKNDSLYFFYEEKPDEAYYSAKIIFQGDKKFALIDSNGEADFERTK